MIRPASRDGGQSMVELALVIPLWAIFAFACFQFAVLFLAQVSLMKSGRDAGRWLAVHPHTLDSDTMAAVGSRLPPNLRAANLSISFSPTCTTLTAGRCPNRAPGQQISLTLSYDARSLVFLPPTIGFGDLVVRIPTALSPYTVYVAAEPP
jgi:Flp pilus assembly protein TadG